MGKIFVERLLRVTEVKKIILLIRHKKGIEPKERLISLVNDAVSNYLKFNYSRELKKNYKCPILGLRK
jgi:hypothetical protein